VKCDEEEGCGEEKKSKADVSIDQTSFFFILMGFVCYSMPLCDKKGKKRKFLCYFFAMQFCCLKGFGIHEVCRHVYKI
jgi:hypothetical protein